MTFHAKPTDPLKIEADLLVVFGSDGAKEGDVVFSPETKRVDAALGGLLSKVVAEEDFEAGIGESLHIHSHGKIPSARILFVGLGSIKKLTIAGLQTVAATISRQGKRLSAKRIAVSLPVELYDRYVPAKVGQTLVEGMRLGSYVFNRHKSKKSQDKEKHIEDVLILVSANKLDTVTGGIKLGVITAEAVCFARDLVNEPSSVTTPTYLGAVAKTIAKRGSGITAEVLGFAEMQKLGMHGLLGIAKGSDEEPAFIKLTYRGSEGKTIALVGKGITFDSGGLSLKPSNGMETMKIDMAGAAAILGIFHVLSLLKPKVTVVGLIAATENMPSGKAIKPGDIVQAMNGKTIEILNTDAEGRVVLADALSYAVELVKPDVIIDLATLTGACEVALGPEYAGLFVNDAKLAGALKTVANDTGELVWELPLAVEYKELLKSTVADIKNISGSRYGGAINAALFLAEFVPGRLPWAHLDIAGPAYAEKDTPLTPVGGTGFGVRTILEYLR